ncbi:DUF4199 domain-containing protein [Aureisphaera galaxeae]|uniref:DUF4199 domain-containing protein n=1 Tax=Aureisphaera galaxeae TaxID=1538023 RepID=UPI00234FFC70|nr:DUF4199 domain-containing protein [Aureisphaera galaxeae]MDC8003622.1 DUF4199 domain-containing protein [Aureisphaera galaxeae]
MDNSPVSIKKTAINSGLIIGGILLLIVAVMYATGMLIEGVQWPMYLFYVLFPLLIGYTVFSYRKANGGFLTLGQALKVGVTAAVISALMYAVYNIIFVNFIDPEFTKDMIEVTKNKMIEQNPNMTDEQLESTMGFIEKFSNPFLGGAFWIVMSAFFGFIYSLISGLIFKKERV